MKVNVGTQLNIAFTETVRTAVRDASSPDPRPYLTAARSAMEDVVVRLIGVIGDRAGERTVS